MTQLSLSSKLHRYLEYTKLSATLTYAEVDQMILDTKQHNFVGICVPPFWVKKVSRGLGDTNVQVVTVIGFPLGYQMTETKVQEMELAIQNGANELDIVMNLSAFKSGMPWVKIEIAKCASLAHEHGCLLKVILETTYLTDDEIVTACKICADAGADFVKTSTGFADAGASVHHVQLMRKTLPSNVGIKASGGIKTAQQAITLIEVGADRIGASTALIIINE
ncbi:deoxyribose-phosphate aldolase [Tunicatimonas pelagia]|uniref:deoxyribose-phosphate aldolase n=1 Tax=Tunicatimonas pelagia TaxID=931531 RepID=UPI00266667E7|nr:deoxyribose-phosphate aldolase [Tunicatimonas pelagia]WKN46007.1 deoxyribose-phosphate aldolase [Tunicatimonas pelagia]